MKLSVLMMLLFSMPALASECDLSFMAEKPVDSYADAALPRNGVCFSLYDSWAYTAERLKLNLKPGDLDDDEAYWRGWLLSDPKDGRPIITQQLQQSYIGVGIWMPPALSIHESDMSTEEWLLSHGIKFSLAFGEKRFGQPRVRLDYRWHQIYHADWFMQVEVPF